MLKFLDHLEEVFISFLMAGAVLLIFVAVIHRYPPPATPSSGAGLAARTSIWLGPGTLHHHVHLDGQIRRCLRRPHGYPSASTCWSTKNPLLCNKFIMFALLAGATFTGIVAYFGTHFIWENGMHYALFNLLGLTTDMFPGPTTRIWNGRPGRSTVPFRPGFGPDVLPLPAGSRRLHSLRTNCPPRSRRMWTAWSPKRCRRTPTPPPKNWPLLRLISAMTKHQGGRTMTLPLSSAF